MSQKGVMMKIFNFKEFKSLDLKEPEFLVDQLIYEQTISIVVAKPKVGKSIFCRNLSCALAKGEEFMGYKTKKSKVLYIPFEENLYNVRKQFRTFMGDTETDNLFIADQTEFISFESLEGAITSYSVDVVFLDTMIRALDIKDINLSLIHI